MPSLSVYGRLFATTLATATTKLLQEKRHTETIRLVSEPPNPIKIHRSSLSPTLATHDQPIQRHPYSTTPQIDRFQEWFGDTKRTAAGIRSNTVILGAYF